MPDYLVSNFWRQLCRYRIIDTFATESHGLRLLLRVLRTLLMLLLLESLLLLLLRAGCERGRSIRGGGLRCAGPDGTRRSHVAMTNAGAECSDEQRMDSGRDEAETLRRICSVQQNRARRRGLPRVNSHVEQPESRQQS